MKWFSAAVKVLGGAMIYAIARAASGMLWPLSAGFSAIPENEAWFTLPALALVGLGYSMILRFYSQHSSEKTWVLALKTFAVFVLVNTVQSQVETLYFREAFPMITDADLAGVFVMGFITSILFVPACIFLHRAGFKTKAADPNPRDFYFGKAWWRYALSALAYLPLYLGFGMLAQLSPDLKAEYAEWVVNDRLLAFLPLWQVARGMLFAAATVLLFSIFSARSKAILGTALSLTFFISLELLFPNIIMSPTLRLVHFFELNGSMALYSLAAGFLLLKKKRA